MAFKNNLKLCDLCCQFTKQHFLREPPNTCTTSKGQLSCIAPDCCWKEIVLVNVMRYLCWAAPRAAFHVTLAQLHIWSIIILLRGCKHGGSDQKRQEKMSQTCVPLLTPSNAKLFLIYLIGIHIELYITSMCIFHDSIAMQLQSTITHPKYFTSAHFFQAPIGKCLKWC